MADKAPTRRMVAAGLAAMPFAVQAQPMPSAAAEVNRSRSSESFADTERALLAGRTPIAAGITLDVPKLSENGNSVDVLIKVDSAMTREDHVRAIHILSEQNPFPRVATFNLTARAGRAEVATRIRLATTQNIVVLAETSRGAVHRAEQEVIVILGACVDGG
jgi:sulfur-oxidizing protein SoxY